MAETTSTVRALREERGWSQGRLAAEVGVSRQTINAIETGRFDPSLPLALRLAHLFARPVEEIFRLTDG
ncbi:helix-turn-helix transcriptional regulator [Ornithinimicrobium sufpigmenti]|uniref:helix-turn-helix transcriptional regulator n=1 Tax=Ornithinimicrobium sufpigmenti TaxID=2508882 RepID=UPI00103630AF|nr:MULTISPECIES: helix-turn-helix transcriptional regulator [unclassified Ornithinimicrobium]